MTDTTLSGPDVGARVVRGSIIRLAGFVVINLLGAVGVAILQRHLGVATYGEYGTVLALIAIVSTIADAGLTATGSRELALQAPGDDRRDLLGPTSVSAPGADDGRHGGLRRVRLGSGLQPPDGGRHRAGRCRVPCCSPRSRR